MSKDGCSFDTWYNNVQGKANTFLAVKTKAGKIFGGFTEIPWKNYGRHLNDPECETFVWMIKDGVLEIFEH